MKAVNRYLLEIDNSPEAIFLKRYGSLKYYVPETYIEDKGVFPQHGIVHSVPKTNPLGLKEGDTVIFSHIVRERLLEGNIYCVESELIYGKEIDGGFEMFNKRIMADRVEEKKEENGIVISLNNHKEMEAIVTSTYKGSPFKVGDKVGVTQESFYQFTFDGKDMFMLDVGISVPFYFKEDGIGLVDGWTLIEPLDEDTDFAENQKGIILHKGRIADQRSGRVVQAPEGSDLNVGDKVLYQKRGYLSYYFEGKRHYFAYYKGVYDMIEMVIPCEVEKFEPAG